ncbi:hypothetical protein FRC07_000346 [Ceratobasidium sp. 392]|nr:hypothetical protein FRC07_000346 [Ceratobasidium sp. 392]
MASSTAPQDTRSHRTFSYEVLSGYFVHYDPESDPTTVGPNPPAFGLKHQTSELYWAEFKNSIAKLQSEAPEGVKYVVCWFGRHGEGWHNIADATYGRDRWDSYWGKLNTDGKITWADAELTELGKEQAKQAAEVWITEMNRPEPVPLPTKVFSSPLSRAVLTLEITFSEVLERTNVRPYIIEDLREMIGIHTCDKRRTKSLIQQLFPGFDLEPGFTEEDELWSPTERETDAGMEPRLKRALDYIFGSLLGDDDTYISITAHSGTIAAALRILGHREYRLPTGGVIPAVIRATPE